MNLMWTIWCRFVGKELDVDGQFRYFEHAEILTHMKKCQTKYCRIFYVGCIDVYYTCSELCLISNRHALFWNDMPNLQLLISGLKKMTSRWNGLTIKIVCVIARISDMSFNHLINRGKGHIYWSSHKNKLLAKIGDIENTISFCSKWIHAGSNQWWQFV